MKKQKCLSDNSDLVLGVGNTDCIMCVDSQIDFEYNLWYHMLSRCYNERSRYKNESYKDCYVSDEWLRYSNFKRDVSKMKGFCNNDWHLDKDILIKGNKLYSKDTCCFVPREINNLLTNRKRFRGELPIGVSFRKMSHGKNYRSICNKDGKSFKLGYFETPHEAYLEYKRFKESAIKEKAIFYKDSLDIRVFDSLMNYEVCECD